MNRDEIHRERVRALCEQLGIRIERCGRNFRLVAPGVDLVVTDLRAVRPEELEHANAQRWSRR